MWHHLQYVIGFQKMGFDILFTEHSNSYASCYNPITNEMSADPAYGLEFIASCFNRYASGAEWCYFNSHLNKWNGKSLREVVQFAQDAELFINLSGLHPVGELFNNIPVRIYIDTDPVFTQIKHLSDQSAMEIATAHSYFFSYGENFNLPECSIPDDGLNWQPTRQPLIPELWNHDTNADQSSKWTTVMQWDSYPSKTINGKTYGMKSASFNNYFNLPKKTTESFELAMGSQTAPKEKLIADGWKVISSLSVTLQPEMYRQYIQRSKGEWSVAKQGYVDTNSGWFSERTVAYLASARPAIVQDTGFSSSLITGNGLFSFDSPESALIALDIINSNYPRHCAKAREVAIEYFHFEKVLSDMLDSI